MQIVPVICGNRQWFWWNLESTSFIPIALNNYLEILFRYRTSQIEMPLINNIPEFREKISGFLSTYNGGKTAETLAEVRTINEIPCNLYINEFWTSRQRQASSIHEVSYRACFKPQLPRFFIELLTDVNDIVYDPFTGRGTSYYRGSPSRQIRYIQ